MKQRHLILILFSVVFLLAFSGEQDFHKDLQEKLDGYYYRNMPVKISLFFNQSQYAPGDTAFYRAAFFTAHDHEPIKGRQIINVILTDNQGARIKEQKILVENGWGRNQLIVPATLTPAAYTVVAYSDWMRNHDARLFSYNKMLITKGKQLAPDHSRHFGLFPEGGVLSAGVNNKIVALGKPGSVVNVTDNSGKTVASCTIDKNGIGLFYLMALENEQYNGLMGQEKTRLPSPSSLGISMVTTPPSPGKPLKIAFEKSEAIKSDESFYLAIVNQRKVYYSAKGAFGGRRNAILSVPYENLLPGLSLITVFREDGTAIFNRIIFVRDFDQAMVETKFSAATFSPREKVSVDLQLTDSNGKPVEGKFSVSVLDSALMANSTIQSMVRQLSTTDLPFSGIGEPLLEGMDDYAFNNFLVSQEWLRYKWADVMEGKTFDRYPLQANLQFTGQLKHPEETPFGDSTIVTFYLQRDVMVYQSMVGPDGKFDFPILFDFQDYDEVYYRVETKKREVKGVTLAPEPSSVPAFTLPEWRETSLPSAYGLFATDRALVDGAYTPVKALQSYTFRSKTALDGIRQEYFIPDREVKLTDYALFPTMAETFREVIPFVAHRVVNSRNVLRVFLYDEKTMSTNDPVLIIDGVMTDDFDYLMSLKPENVDVVKVLSSKKNKEKFGPIGRNGVVIVETKIPGNAKNVPRSKSMFYATGVSQPLVFSNISEKSFQPRVPVMRSCLYWNPEIRTDADGKATFYFYTTDNTGAFTIIMDGLTVNGEPVHAEEKFKVVFLPTN